MPTSSRSRMECPSCAMIVDAGPKACPICDYEFPRPNRWIAVGAIALILLFLYRVVVM